MNFFITQRGHVTIMVVADRFTKITYFMLCHKSDVASHIVHFYFKDILKLLGLQSALRQSSSIYGTIHFRSFLIGLNIFVVEAMIVKLLFQPSRIEGKSFSRSLEHVAPRVKIIHAFG